MARLVLGTDINNTGTSSIVRDLSPVSYREYTTDQSGVLVADIKSNQYQWRYRYW